MESLQGEGSSDGVSDQCVGTDTCSVATETEPDCLGPCEPGTHVNLDGIVWQETENGQYAFVSFYHENENFVPGCNTGFI